MPDKKILIVDDDTRVRELLYEFLARKGYRLFSACGGKEALELLSQVKPDLVLTDISMPGMSGIELVRAMNGAGFTAKSVMLTGMDSEELEKEARMAGASGFLKKSLDLPVIADAVDSLLNDDRKPAAQRVLVVDDNEGICMLLKRFLKKKGFLPLTAGSGEEALELFAAEKPHLVLLDINLPGMDGLMTLKKIRGVDPRAAVIMITGVKDETIAEQAIRMGAFDYIVKPFELDYLEMSLLTKISLSVFEK